MSNTTTNRVTRRSYKYEDIQISVWTDDNYYLNILNGKGLIPREISRDEAAALIKTFRLTGKVERHVTTSFAL